MKTPLALLLIVTTFALIAVGCGGNGDPTPQPLTKVSVALDWFPWSNHSGLFIAQERGYFAEQGLEVDIFVPGDPSTVLQTVAAGKDDFGISYQPELLIAREQGIPAVSIMALAQHPLNSVMTLKESGIVEPRDLAGKKVGSPGLPSDEALLDTMLEFQGLSLEDVEMVNVGFDLVLSQLGFGNCLRKRLRLLPFFRSVDVGGWQPWDENGMWSGWKGKNETSWND